MTQVEIFRDSIALFFPLQYSSAIRVAEHMFAKLFNGFTTLEGFGGWLNPDNSAIVRERVAIVESYTESLTNKQLEFVRRFAAHLGFKYDQYCVAIRVNGRLEIIQSREFSDSPENFYQVIPIPLDETITTILGGQFNA